MRMQKIGGIAAIVEFAAYTFGIAVGFSALAAFMTGNLQPLELVAFITENFTLLYVWNAVIMILFGVFLIVLVLALHERLGYTAPSVRNTATAFGIIWAGLVLASGMIFNVGISAVADLYASDPGNAASTWLAIAVVQDGLGGGNELVGGLWTLLVSWAAMRGRMLPRPLNWLGMVAGFAGVVTILPGLESLGLLFGLGQLVWFAWLGVFLIGGRSGEVRSRSALRVSIS